MGVKEAFEWHEGVCSKLAIFSTGRTRELQKLVFGSDVSFAKASRLGGMGGRSTRAPTHRHRSYVHMHTGMAPTC